MVRPSRNRTLAIFDSDKRGGATAAAAVVMAVLIVATVAVVSSNPTTYRAETNSHGDDYNAIKSGLENSIEEQGVQQTDPTESTEAVDTTRNVHKIRGNQGLAGNGNPFSSTSAKRAFVKDVIAKLPAQAQSALAKSPVFANLDRSTQVGMTELLDSVAEQQQSSGEVTTVDPVEDKTEYGTLVFVGAEQNAESLSLAQYVTKTRMVPEQYWTQEDFQWADTRTAPGPKWRYTGAYSDTYVRTDTKAARSSPGHGWEKGSFAYSKQSNTKKSRQVWVNSGYTKTWTETHTRRTWVDGYYTTGSRTVCTDYETIYYPRYGITTTECANWGSETYSVWHSGYWDYDTYEHDHSRWVDTSHYETEYYYPTYDYYHYSKDVYDRDYKYRLPPQQKTRMVEEAFTAIETTEVESNAVELPSQTGGVTLLSDVDAARDGRLTVLRDSLPATKANALTLTASEDTGAGSWWLKAWAPTNSTIKVQTSAMSSPTVIEDSKATINLDANTVNGESESLGFANGLDESYSVTLTNSEGVYGSLIILGKGEWKATADADAFSSIQSTDGIYSTEFTVTYQTQQTTYTDLIKVTPAYSDELRAADTENATASS